MEMLPGQAPAGIDPGFFHWSCPYPGGADAGSSGRRIRQTLDFCLKEIYNLNRLLQYMY